MEYRVLIQSLVQVFQRRLVLYLMMFLILLIRAEYSASATAIEYSVEPISPISEPQNIDAARAALGERLFNDPRLSSDDTVSCANCHVLSAGGDDGLVHSFGVNGAEGVINSPTVYNSSLNFVQFWDGRAPTLEEQVVGPVHNPIEMASNWVQVIGKLNQDPEYVSQFRSVFSEGLTAESIKSALAEYERTLVTPDSPFDRYLKGNHTAISADAKEGYRLFKSYGCSSCHQGQSVGGNMYEKMGIFHDYFADRGNVTDADLGRFNLTREELHRYEFKVPSLRNIALTAPYFHDGSAKSLGQAVRTMGWYQLGRRIPDDDVKNIVAFLESLTGQHKDLAQ